jgi:hypothetical protein
MIDESESLNIGRLKKYAALAEARRKLKEKYDQLGKRLANMAPALINHLIDHEMDKVPLKGGRTIYIDTKIWSKYLPGKTIEDLVNAAKEDGIYEQLGGKESLNAQSLAAYLRELDRQEKDLPKNLKQVIEPNPVSNLVVRKQ